MTERRHAIAERNHFALFGEADAALEAAGRLREDGAVRASPAASDGAAAPVKEPDADARSAAHCRETRLRVIKRPVGGEKTAILGAVGIAEHDFLKIAACLQ